MFNSQDTTIKSNGTIIYLKTGLALAASKEGAEAGVLSYDPDSQASHLKTLYSETKNDGNAQLTQHDTKYEYGLLIDQNNHSDHLNTSGWC